MNHIHIFPTKYNPRLTPPQSIFYNISIVLIKVAMLLQVLRIFVPRGSQSKTYYIVHALIWLNALYYLIIVFLMLFNCRPIRKAWTPWLPGKCMQIGLIAMTTAIVNLIGDLCILFLTQNVIWNLMRVDRRQRMKLSVVFLAGVMYVLSPPALPSFPSIFFPKRVHGY